MLTLLCKSKNNIDVYIDLENSHATTHIKNNPKLLDYVKQIVQNHNVTKNEERFETDMKFPVGMMDLVETTGSDEIVYAKRKNRDKYTRFVKNRKPEKTTIVTTDIRKSEDGKHFVFTVYSGRLTPKFPGGDKENPNSRSFWSKHALVWGTQEIIPGTETNKCPW